MALSIQTQAGLASMIDSLVAADLDLTYLREYRTRLESVTVDDVLTMSRRYLAPRGLLTVMVGDAEQIEPQAAALDPVRVVEL
jgi:predicted Zn-dependent peptidase